MANYLKTEHGAAICPFFMWQSEYRPNGLNSLKDVNLVFCNHPDNAIDSEGNCQKECCPLLKKCRDLRAKRLQALFEKEYIKS